MLDDVRRAGAESSASAQRSSEGANEHIDLRGIDILGFCETTAGSTHNTEGPGFVKHEAEFVSEFELNLHGHQRISLRFEIEYVPALADLHNPQPFQTSPR